MEQAQEIRVKLSTGNITQSKLAEEYGVSRTAIYGILNNLTYKE